MSQTDFQKAIKFVLEAEGGYTNDPIDPGGETNFGIDKRSHPNVNIKDLTINEATDIYFEEYWTKFNCDQFKWPLNCVYFDSCVNTGQRQSNKFLQRAVGTQPDGVVGPKTLGAIQKKEPDVVALEVINQRQKFYENLAESKPPLKKFLKGWTNRNNNLKKFIA